MKTVAIDVGGTFTDCLVLDELGELREFKAPSTPPDYVVGVLDSLEKAASHFGASLPKFLGGIGVIVHGTTVATNAVFTGGGVPTGMITTKNFRDIYEIRRGFKLASMFNLFLPPYKPLIPRYLRIGVDERTLHSGEILTPLKEEEVAAAVDYLKGQGVQSIAICFLHSYANPENEQRAMKLCKAAAGEVYLAASHEVLPVWREYERFSTTVLSAYVGPIVDRYLSILEQRLLDMGFQGALLMVLNSSLVQTVEHCRRRAVHLVGSGPAAAPTAGLYLARQAGHPNLISFDMGGTSTDVSVIWNGQIPTTTEGWVGDERIAVKQVDVHCFGAGGGSIAWVDRLGVLKVGPASAGARPGPACYDQGGYDPTITDADLVLGYLPHDYFLGGEIPLRMDLARKAIGRLGQQLGKGVEETAEAIFTVANTLMAGEITTVSTKRGYDVRDFALLVGGGAGPVHCMWLAEELGITTVIVPRFAALYSAFGMLTMDMGWEYARSYLSRVKKINLEALNMLFGEMELRALESLRRLHVPSENVVLVRSADMRYEGQYHEVEVSIPKVKLTQREIESTVKAFHRRHEELYAFTMPEQDVEFLTFYLRVSVPQARVKLPLIETGSRDPSAALKRHRYCLFNGKGVDTLIYEGERLRAGNLIIGPAIIEEATTTIVIPEGFQCTVTELGNYILTK